MGTEFQQKYGKTGGGATDFTDGSSRYGINIVEECQYGDHLHLFFRCRQHLCSGPTELDLKSLHRRGDATDTVQLAF